MSINSVPITKKKKGICQEIELPKFSFRLNGQLKIVYSKLVLHTVRTDCRYRETRAWIFTSSFYVDNFIWRNCSNIYTGPCDISIKKKKNRCNDSTIMTMTTHVVVVEAFGHYKMYSGLIRKLTNDAFELNVFSLNTRLRRQLRIHNKI